MTLHAAGAAVERLPFAVRALLIGDLPTNLWWAAPQPPPLAGPLLLRPGRERPADHVRQPRLAQTRRAAWRPRRRWLEQIERGGAGGRWRVASDLNWRRLKYWRRLLMQALDPASAPGAAESVSEVLVEHGPHAVVQAWELVQLADAAAGLAGAGRQGAAKASRWPGASPRRTATRFVRVRRLDEGPPEVRRIRIACTLDGKPAR